MLFYRITEFSKAYPAGIEADINTNDPRTPAHAILPAWAQHSTKPCEKQEYRMRLRPPPPMTPDKLSAFNAWKKD